MSYMMPLESEVESVRGQIEKVMLQLDPTQTPEEHRQYLKGYIDCLQDTGEISEEIHDIVYAEYGS